MTSIQHLRILARLFTRTVLAQLSRGEVAHSLAFLRETGVAQQGARQPLSTLFESAFRQLNAAYRNEYVYKAALADRIIFGRHSPRTAALQVEMPVGSSIVDAAVFNGTSTAYEIKTEFDSCQRLKTQTSDYLQVFDRVYLVTHPDFVERMSAGLDARVGVLALEKENRLRVVQEATSNETHVAASRVFRVLRQREYMDAVETHLGPQPTLPNGLRFTHYERLFSTLSSAHAHQAFVNAMRLRTTDSSFVEFVSLLPSCLRVLAYATPLSFVQRRRLLANIASDVDLHIAS